MANFLIGRRYCFVLLATIVSSSLTATSVEANAVDDGFYYATRCAATAGRTWGLAEHDGANRPTPAYLSSLVDGETQTGSIGSPPFEIRVDAIRFTIRGHDGQGGGRGKNFVALVDNKTGKILRQTAAPGNDALQERSWDVGDLKGRTVRFEAVDGDADSAFAWLGVGQIDAGEALKVDFRHGMPDDWKTTNRSPNQSERAQMVMNNGAVPFLTYEDSYTWIPENGAVQIAIGAQVKRLFVLGCTVPANRVLGTYGYLDIVYGDDTKDQVPLVYGYTLEGAYKTSGNYTGLQLLPVGDGTQYMLSLQPSEKEIQRLELRRASPDTPRPRISAITCEMAVEIPEDELPNTSGGFTRLQSRRMDTETRQWLDGHTILTGAAFPLDAAQAIRRERGVPATLAEVQQTEDRAPVTFDREKISAEAFEAASVCDVDMDGDEDIVSGNFWYSGPDFAKKSRFRSLEEMSGYHDSFHDYPMDVDGDGDADIVSGGWFGGTLLWCENPGPPFAAGNWQVHDIARTGAIETTRFWDVDGDGHVEIVPNAGGNVVFFRLNRDENGRGTGRFSRHVAKLGGCGHGLGFGDVNGDGRGDFVIPDGWLEAPADPLNGEWTYHAEFQLGSASVPILVHDVNEDGLADLIFGHAHGYGLYWAEQKKGDDGARIWEKHLIDGNASQYHDVMLADLNGDRRMELVTGKRYRAHNGNDPGSADPVFVRYFSFDRFGIFTPHTLDYGEAGTASGVGIYFWVDDVDKDGCPDIIAPGKEGLFLFRNRSAKN